MLAHAQLIDDGEEQIVVFPPGYLDGVEEVVLERRVDDSILVTPVAPAE